MNIPQTKELMDHGAREAINSPRGFTISYVSDDSCPFPEVSLEFLRLVMFWSSSASTPIEVPNF